MRNEMNPRERLVFHVQELERVERLKAQAVECVRDAMDAAKDAGYDPQTLRVVLKLRKMTPAQRRERRALEAIYMAALGMLEGEALPEAARSRLDEPEEKPTDAPPSRAAESDEEAERSEEDRPAEDAAAPPDVPLPPQAPLVLKTPEEARQEGADAAAAGKRVFDNPYAAGDPCRAAWDEGWCARGQSHGMETPAAFQRRSAKPPAKEPSTPPSPPPDPSNGAGADNRDQPGAA